jgi:hypothetical protein
MQLTIYLVLGFYWLGPSGCQCCRGRSDCRRRLSLRPQHCHAIYVCRIAQISILMYPVFQDYYTHLRIVSSQDLQLESGIAKKSDGIAGIGIDWYWCGYSLYTLLRLCSGFVLFHTSLQKDGLSHVWGIEAIFEGIHF